MSLRFAVLGQPIAHSKSPAMHQAAFDALGLPHRYEKLETSAAELPLRVASLRDGTFAGFNVTVPLKTQALALADSVDEAARVTGAANTLVRLEDGRVHALNTDAPALEQEISVLREGQPLTGKSAIVIGTGGAARAAIVALARLGVGKLVVRGRRELPDLRSVLFAVAPGAVMTFEPLGAGAPRLGAAEPGDLGAIVQTTTSGMLGGAPGEVAAEAIDWASVPLDAVVYDVVYGAAPTELVRAAMRRKLACSPGLGMLVRQGALGFEAWLGIRPPLDVMRRALEVL